MLVSIEIVAAFVLAAVHAVSPRMRFLDSLPRSRWLSAAGGISIAYVFVHLLPELSERQSEAFEGEQRVVAAETELFVVALIGLLAFYGLERLVSRHQDGKTEGRDAQRAGAGVFWLHIASFALYNALIGYLLAHREEGGLGSLLTYTFAMAVHFVVNDRGLYQHHKDRYLHVGRWMVSAAALIGLGVGLLTEIGEIYLSLLFAFLAGGVVLNVLKEELPEERESAFWALALGAGAYAGLLHFA